MAGVAVNHLLSGRGLDGRIGDLRLFVHTTLSHVEVCGGDFNNKRIRTHT